MNVRLILSTMILIRTFEERVEEYFSKGLMRGTAHSSIGQELAPSCLAEFVDIKNDYVFATHRGHGYFLACTNRPYLLACEMMGRRNGPVFGGGGSQHIKYYNFYTNGITGGMAPLSVGTAFALNIQKNDAICVSILGDGGFNEGYVQEALNLASVYRVPILFLLENNKYAMSTESAIYTAGTIKKRVQSYGISYVFLDSKDPNTFYSTLKQTVWSVRKSRIPIFVEVDTFRFCGHSKNDDCKYMNPEERASYLAADPIVFLSNQLDKKEADELVSTAKNAVKQAFEDAERCDEITLSEFIVQRERILNAGGHFSRSQ